MLLPASNARPPAPGVAQARSVPALAYLGPAGTFTEQALRSVPEADGSPLRPAASAAAALADVRDEVAGAAMLPVHNSSAGLVPDTLRALVDSPSTIVVREVRLSVDFALLVRPGTPLSQVRTVSGHPHAGVQVRRWLKCHVAQARWVPASSNGEAARGVGRGAYDAAVAGEFAAARYGLEAVARGIQDVSAVTRFLLCARHDTTLGSGLGTAATTSLVGRLDGPGQMDALLSEMRSHPLLEQVCLGAVDQGGQGGLLLVDCPGRMSRVETARAVALLQLRLPRLRRLGSYASSPPVPSPYERSQTMPNVPATPKEASAEPESGDIGCLREEIDAIDRSLIGSLRRRLETSREIQRLRTGGGGTRLDSGREHEIRSRYAESLGQGGSAVADAVLEMCRGQAPR